MAAERIEDLPRIGNVLCLDLVNLVEPRVGAVDRDHLSGFGDVVSWALGGEVIDADDAAALRRFADGHPRLAAQVFEQAIELRETLHGVFAAIADRRPPRANDVQRIVRAHATYIALAGLERQGDVFDWGWGREVRARVGGRAFERREDVEVALLGEAVSSAVDLLRSGPLDRVKACPVGEGGCAWVFLDTSKNRSRRWCSMQDCGARVKSQRHYARRRAST